jgi:hypothetical protein
LYWRDGRLAFALLQADGDKEARVRYKSGVAKVQLRAGKRVRVVPEMFEERSSRGEA